MHSRAATSLTLLGRHLERADHLARILGVHVALSLDRTDEPGPEFWTRFMELAEAATSDTSPTDGRVVKLRPEQVVEIAFDGVQGSSRYPGGMALRFARVVRYRDDKGPADADTIDTVRAMYRG